MKYFFFMITNKYLTSATFTNLVYYNFSWKKWTFYLLYLRYFHLMYFKQIYIYIYKRRLGEGDILYHLNHKKYNILLQPFNFLIFNYIPLIVRLYNYIWVSFIMYFNEITSVRLKYVIMKEDWKLICELNKLLKKHN